MHNHLRYYRPTSSEPISDPYRWLDTAIPYALIVLGVLILGVCYV